MLFLVFLVNSILAAWRTLTQKNKETRLRGSSQLNFYLAFGMNWNEYIK